MAFNLDLVTRGGVLHDSVESSVFVRAVLNSSDGSISFLKTVHSLHNITITEFMLEFVVSGVRVLYFVLVLVFRVRIIVDGLVVEIVSVSIVMDRYCVMDGYFVVNRNSVLNGSSMVNGS